MESKIEKENKRRSQRKRGKIVFSGLLERKRDREGEANIREKEIEREIKGG